MNVVLLLVDENDDDDNENDDDENDDEDNDDETNKTSNNKILKAKLKSNNVNIEDKLFEDDSDEEDYNIDDYIRYNYPEKQQCSLEEMYTVLDVKRNKDNVIEDPNHTTLSILTKYERARILGTRAAQLNDGSEPYIKIPSHIVDSYVIAEKELKEKALPFIISRPLPNGRIEYWRLSDLEILHE